LKGSVTYTQCRFSYKSINIKAFSSHQLFFGLKYFSSWRNTFPVFGSIRRWTKDFLVMVVGMNYLAGMDKILQNSLGLKTACMIEDKPSQATQSGFDNWVKQADLVEGK
jgi:hypothetical protein